MSANLFSDLLKYNNPKVNNKIDSKAEKPKTGQLIAPTPNSPARIVSITPLIGLMYNNH